MLFFLAVYPIVERVRILEKILFFSLCFIIYSSTLSLLLSYLLSDRHSQTQKKSVCQSVCHTRIKKGLSMDWLMLKSFCGFEEPLLLQKQRLLRIGRLRLRWLLCCRVWPEGRLAAGCLRFGHLEC
jgi:hypothetical protein